MWHRVCLLSSQNKEQTVPGALIMDYQFLYIPVILVALALAFAIKPIIKMMRQDKQKKQSQIHICDCEPIYWTDCEDE